jgi:hypothetical protein
MSKNAYIETIIYFDQHYVNNCKYMHTFYSNLSNNEHYLIDYIFNNRGVNSNQFKRRVR